MTHPTPFTSRRQLVALAIAVVVSVLVVATASSSQAASQSCPTFGSSIVTGELTRDSIKEASGLVASPNFNYRFWTHNDSGDSARIFAMTGNGADRGVVNLGGITARDFEDIAIGPGPNANKDYIYVADIGNNGKSRSTVWIYRFVEPEPPGKGKSITIPGNQIERFEYAYENPNDPGKTWKRNAESLFVDPISNDVVIIEKQLTTVGGKADMGWVYKISQSNLKEGSVIKAKPKVAVRQRRTTDYGPFTGADISPNGKVIIAKNGSETFAWKRDPSKTVYSAFSAFPISTCYPPSTPGEAIAFNKGGGAVLSITEQKNSKVRRFTVTGGRITNGGGTNTTEPPPATGEYHCDGLEPTIIGTHGDDVINGTDGVDVIVGLGGDDTIMGLKGDDYICGGPGSDVLYGNQGKDEIHGGDGADLIKGGFGADFLVGSAGFDVIYGHDGEDYLAGAVGNDKLFGGNHADELQAGAGTDTCKGGAGDDELFSCE